MNFAEKIQKMRKERDLSQEELAEILHVSRQAVSKWEAGQCMPDLNKLIDLSEYFNTSIDSLVKDEETRSDKEPFEKESAEKREAEKQNGQMHDFLASKTKRMILTGLAAACILICLFGIGYADRAASAYQTVFVVICGVIGITLSVFVLIKIKRYIQKNG